MPKYLVVLFLLSSAASSARAQTATVVFDEDDPAGEGYYEASVGETTGPDALDLLGPTGNRMPILTTAAQRGSESGRITYAHEDGGSWSLVVGAPGFTALDFTEVDSVAVYLNGPSGIAETELPRIGLEDADGVRSALLPIDLPGRIGLNAGRSGFLEGSDTDAALSVAYVQSLPADLVRLGYPEDLTIVFADEAVSISTATIGVPAVPAHFTVETASGTQLDFRFRDTDGDGTISTASDYVTVLTPDGSGALRPTWQITLASAEPASPPDDGDRYLLAVDNGGLDVDPATWQRFAVAVADFGPLIGLDLSWVRGVRFAEGGVTAEPRTLWIDYVAALAYDGNPVGPQPPSDIDARAGNESVVFRWDFVPGAESFHVYRQTASGMPFERLTTTPTRIRNFADLNVENGQTYTYVFRSLAPGSVPGPDSSPVVATPMAEVFDPYIDLLAETAFDYFWEEANPANGLIKDRSTPGSASSIAAVGFGLSAITVGIDRGWITRDEGRERVLNTLQFFRDCPQSDAEDMVCGYRGFFYHFLNMQTGHRAGTNELSTIDTALLLGGILHAREYFDTDAADEVQIRTLADAIYERVEWDWAANRPPLVTLGWKPEQGFAICGGNLCDWRGYNEAMILYILGMGSPTHPLPDGAWDAWSSTYDGDWGTFYGYTFLSFPPLFGHQYSHLWVDFRGIQDAYMEEKGIDYFENSRRATLASRAYAIDNPRGHPGYGPDEWGLTASDDPFGYRAHGAPPAQSDNGTITPTAAGGSIAFAPEETRLALRNFYRKYRARLWGEYGLRDAYNIRENWFGSDFLGIDQGPFVIMIENLRTERVWDAFMRNEDVQRGLRRAGFKGKGVSAEADATPESLPMLRVYPNPTTARAEVRFSLPAASPVSVQVYDVLGRRVATLAEETVPAGEHRAVLDASGLRSGIYVVELRAPDLVLNHKLTVLH